MGKHRVRLCPYSCGYSTSNPDKMKNHLSRIHANEKGGDVILSTVFS